MMITKKQHVARLKENKEITFRLAEILIKNENDGYFCVSFERIGNEYGYYKNVYDCHIAEMTLYYPEPYNRVKIKVHSLNNISVWYDPEVEDDGNQVYHSEDFDSEQEASKWLKSKDCPILGYCPVSDD